MTSPVIEVRNLEVTFSDRRLLGDRRQVRAVDGVSLEVRPGEIFCIAGESGSGKSTLARTLLGLVGPSSGEVVVDGIEIGSMTSRGARALRRKAQMIFQDPMGSLNPRQTIYEAVVEPIRIHRLEGDERQRVGEALARAGLRPPERFFLSYPHELSGGQRQRVVIAAALALEPNILIADEPVSMLDASVRGEILGLLLSLRERMGLTIVLITHDLGFAWAVADRVAIMYLGRIVELGTVRQVLLHPLHPYTRSLIAAAPEVGAVRKDRRLLSGEVPDPANVPPGCRFHPRCPQLAGGLPRDTAAACRGIEPPLVDVGDGHRAACHPNAPPPIRLDA